MSACCLDFFDNRMAIFCFKPLEFFCHFIVTFFCHRDFARHNNFPPELIKHYKPKNIPQRDGINNRYISRFTQTQRKSSKYKKLQNYGIFLLQLE
jgi:hypothetical protein